MAQKILVIYYSQSGQLRDIIHNIAHPISMEPDAALTYYEIKLKDDFDFPWQDEQFMDTFPESYQQVARDIVPPPKEILDSKFDLILFGYQVWFLTPSIPIISFLKSEYAATILGQTPIITVSATRNMWMLSQEKLKRILTNLHAPLIGNIALVDRNNNYTSVITILKWMKSGNKQLPKPWPEAGVSTVEIKGANKYGLVIVKYLRQQQYYNLQQELVAAGGVEIRPFLVRVEKTGNRIFKIWSGKIMKSTETRPLLIKIFTAYLFVAIWIISPIVLVLHLLFTPFLAQKRRKEKQYLQGIAYNPSQFTL